MSKKRGLPMPLSFKDRHSLARETASRYRVSSKKEKKAILDEFVILTGLTRCHAATLLRNLDRTVWDISKGRPVLFRGSPKSHRRKKGSSYKDLTDDLIWFRETADYIASKRLVIFIRQNAQACSDRGERPMADEDIKRLKKISPSTIDRLLKNHRKQEKSKNRGHTKRGPLLKQQIPIRRHGDFPPKPGYFETDTVSNDGGNHRGDFCQTLTLTDIHTCWTALYGLKNNAFRWVNEAMDDFFKHVPFPLEGIDSDNGGEFINYGLVNWCKERKIEFTRSRVGRKNDNCYVEQKNASVVRRAVGYLRYDTEEQLRLLKKLCTVYTEYTNLFMPVQKLISKERVDGKTKKIYDHAQTPLDRVIGCPDIEQSVKEQWRKKRVETSPVKLIKEIRKLQDKLMRSVIKQNKKTHIQQNHSLPSSNKYRTKGEFEDEKLKKIC